MTDLNDLVAGYRPPDSAAPILSEVNLVLIAGIVGAGKDTIKSELLKDGDFYEIVSHTTRPPRQNSGVMEKHGVDYYFIDQTKAEQMLKNHDFVEAKMVHGNIYGTSLAELQKAKDKSKVAITDIDFQGLKEYLDLKPDTHAIFLLPPSVETWLARLTRRYGDLTKHKDELDKRFKTALGEISYVRGDDRFTLIINDDLLTTAGRIRQLVSGEATQTSGYADKVAEHLTDFLVSKT